MATLAKSASGALELVPIALVQNLARSIDAMKELRFTTIGLDDEAEHLSRTSRSRAALRWCSGPKAKACAS